MTTETLSETELLKLPKWAQQRVRSLEGTVKKITATLDVYENNIIGKTNITFGKQGRLPLGTTVMFTLPDGMISVDVHNDLIRVMGYGTSIICQPQSGNHMIIKPGSLER